MIYYIRMNKNFYAAFLKNQYALEYQDSFSRPYKKYIIYPFYGCHIM